MNTLLGPSKTKFVGGLVCTVCWLLCKFKYWIFGYSLCVISFNDDISYLTVEPDLSPFTGLKVGLKQVLFAGKLRLILLKLASSSLLVTLKLRSFNTGN